MYKHRNSAKAEKYKLAINCCSNLNCNNDGGRLEVHHIIPIVYGGEDTYDNYICLCHNCHHGAMGHLHRDYEEHLFNIQHNKIYTEINILGFDCTEVIDKKFGIKLREFIKNNRIKNKIKCKKCKRLTNEYKNEYCKKCYINKQINYIKNQK